MVEHSRTGVILYLNLLILCTNLYPLIQAKPPTQQCQTPTQTPTSVSTPVSSDERSQRTRSVPQPKPLPRALQDSGSRRTVHNGKPDLFCINFVNVFIYIYKLQYFANKFFFNLGKYIMKYY